MGNPLIVFTATFFFVAFMEGYSAKDTLIFLLWAVATVGVIITATAMWMKFKKQLPNLDIVRREDRYIPYLGSVVGYGLLILILRNHIWDYPMFHALLMTMAVGVIVCGAVNLIWKISFHGFAMGVFSAFVFHYNKLVGILWLVLALAVGWSRVEKRVHTWGQVFAGLSVGFSLALLFIHLWGG